MKLYQAMGLAHEICSDAIDTKLAKRQLYADCWLFFFPVIAMTHSKTFCSANVYLPLTICIYSRKGCMGCMLGFIYELGYCTSKFSKESWLIQPVRWTDLFIHSYPSWINQAGGWLIDQISKICF